MQTPSFTTHHSPHEGTTSLGVENSVGIKTWALEKNTKWESASSAADFRACPGLLGLEARLVPRIWLDWKAVSNHTLRAREQNTQTTVLWRRLRAWAEQGPFSLALGDVMPMSPGPRKCTMTNGVPHFLWIRIPSQRGLSSQGSKAPGGPAGECQSAGHRGPSAVLK